jgi:hypothetical protein
VWRGPGAGATVFGAVSSTEGGGGVGKYRFLSLLR